MKKEDFIKTLKDREIILDTISLDLVPEEFPTKNKLRFVCAKHGEFQKLFSNFLKHPCCSICTIESRSRTIKEYRSILKKSYPSIVIANTRPDTDIIKTKEKIDFICNIHGVYKSIVASTLKGSGCPRCANNIKLTLDEALVLIKQKYPKGLEYLSGTYKNNMSKLFFRCDYCLNESRKSTNQILSSLSSCAICQKRSEGVKRRKSTEEFIRQCTLLFSDLKGYCKYDYSGTVYVKATEKVSIICKEHGPFSIIARDHCNSAKGCPVCSFRLSKAELDLEAFLINEGLQTIRSYRPKWLKGKELDIYIPSLNLAIEYNGIAYHHSTFNSQNLFLNKTAKNPFYHLEKFTLCQKNEVDLLHIFEFEDLQDWKNLIKELIIKRDSSQILFSNSMRIFEGRKYYGISKINFTE